MINKTLTTVTKENNDRQNVENNNDNNNINDQQDLDNNNNNKIRYNTILFNMYKILHHAHNLFLHCIIYYTW